MNKTYRLLFNKSLGTLQVVSELAKSNTSGSAQSPNKKSSYPFALKQQILACAVASFCGVMLNPVTAQTLPGADGGSASGSAAGTGGAGAGGGGNGGNGGDNNPIFGGGGGGGGVSGGGNGGNGSTGAGGAGAVGAPFVGGNGVTEGGGGGGSTALAISGSMTISQDITGGAGGDSGTSGGGGAGFGSGGGGGGGAGVYGSAGAILTINSPWSITGGAGGAGGDLATAGGGGSAVFGNNLTVISNGNITGGAGGLGSDSGSVGGAGGDGVGGDRLRLTNNLGAVISGGAGGEVAPGGYSSGAGGNGVNVLSHSTGSVITNAGTINGGSGGVSVFTTAADGGAGITGSNFVLTNHLGAIITGGSGGISLGGSQSGSGGAGVLGANFSLNNSGTIQGGSEGAGGPSGSGGVGVNVQLGVASSILNTSTGIIQGTGADGLQNDGTITNLDNAGLIRSFGPGGVFGVLNSGTINNLNNSGALSGLNSGLSNNVGATISVLTNANSGSIGGGGTGMTNSGGIGVLINNGQISSTFGTGLLNAGTIGVLTNIGGILAPFGNMISNSGTITTLNNAQGQGSSQGALTYSGQLPNSYNIIITSANSYGKLDVIAGSGGTTFGVSSLSGRVTALTYTGVITGISSANITATTGSYLGATWSLVGSSSNWDLIFTSLPIYGPSTADTQQSISNTAVAMQSTYALQNSVLANSLGYDCNKFGSNGVCISTGGRYTAVSAANGLNNTSALLIAAHRLNKNYRIGAYVDQNLSVNNAGTTVRLGNSTPLIGLFGAWNEKLDGTGTEVKVSAAYGKKNTTVTRQVVGSSEPGSGSSQLNSQGAQITAKHGFVVMPEVIVSPYVGMRYTQNNMQGYTEGTSDAVTAPLAYSALNTRATTALAGVGVNYKVNPTVTTFASAGIEADTKTGNGSYSGTNSNIAGLTPVNFNANPVKTRASAVLGAYYDVEKNQRLAITGIYRQESYKAVSTTTVMATYTVGL